MPEIFALHLFFGTVIPPGYADGMTWPYSWTTREACQQMLAETPPRNGVHAKCLVKLPPRSVPMSRRDQRSASGR